MGLSHAQVDHLLPVFNDIDQTTQQQRYEKGGVSGTRTRTPGGGSKGKWPTMADTLLFVLSYSKTYPPFDVLGTQCDMVRSKAHENLHTLAPILYNTLVHFALMPYRELGTPEDVQVALQGVDRRIIDATERAYHRSQEDAKQREHSSGKKNSLRGKTRSCPCLTR
ncbi:MAG TPA: hypothetical protein VLQ80_06970 [Candidatus Saccharimonadia bacterium]|nr:hypothetical protein [Candidatus Saccharimonadia bacterium]